MISILLSSYMDPLYKIINSFPTIIWTVILAVAILYWIGAVLGILPIDIFESLLPDLDSSMSTESANALVGLMMKFGVVGIPLTISLSFLSLIGWFLSANIVYFSPVFLIETWLVFPYGVMILMVTSIAALILTGYIVKPLKPLFLNNRAQSCIDFIGSIAEIRTSRVDESFGEANIINSGAGLIVQVRTTGPNSLSYGTKVVILEYNQKLNTYLVAAYDV